jgi:hypothetical protein
MTQINRTPEQDRSSPASESPVAGGATIATDLSRYRSVTIESPDRAGKYFCKSIIQVNFGLRLQRLKCLSEWPAQVSQRLGDACAKENK